MRRQGLLWLSAALSLVPASLFGGAAVEGHVDLPKSRSAPIQAKRYEIVTKAGVLSTLPPLAVVYLDGNFPRPASLPTKEVAQRDLTFIPVLLPIEVGTKVQFPNLDDQYHNIFSYSPAKRFDLGRYRPDERPIPSVTFDKAGLVTLRCDIHEHMRGLILVLNTPYFVMTDTAGRFRLDKLPAGRYTLKSWIDSRTTREKSIELKDGQTLHVDLP
ncbi:MAG TPA: carboxypeptidase regulatory-like domain-containing protein [Candidatus Udaeobacter sp.]|jgi:plastocyanin